MSLFSRNKDPVEPGRTDDVPFESLRRSPRDAARGSRRNAPGARAAEPEADAAPLDPAHAEKTRARRRLVGAIALALAAVVFVPMLFDRTQLPPADDIAVQIPDRDAPFEGRRGIVDPGTGPLRPSGSLPASSAPPAAVNAAPVAAAGAGSETAPPPDAAIDAAQLKPAEPASTEKSVAKAAERGAEQKPEKAVEKKAEKAHEKAAEKRAETSGDKGGPATAVAQGDDPRALAALEGKAVPHGSGESVSGKGFAVQIGAYSAAGRAKALRDQLNANGLKAYTESLSTPQGPRTRVRLGPFASREAAERARKKLRTMKLDGSVVTL